MKHFLRILTATLLHTTMVGMETTTIVPENSCSGATLFQQATSQQENEFPSFWGKLSSEQQKELTNNAGQREYNNPGLTALIADNYILDDTITNNLIPSMNMGKIVRYMSKQMLQKNLLCDEENVSQLGGPQKLITHENGSYHSIPKTFEKHGKCTGPTSCTRFMHITNNDEPYSVLSHRTVGHYDYIVTTERGSKNLCIWRIKNATQQEKETWIYQEKTDFMKKTYLLNGKYADAIFSPNGAHIALIGRYENDSFHLFSIDETSADIVTEKINLPKPLPGTIRKPQFSACSTMVAFLSFDSIAMISQLIIHHIPQNRIITLSLQGIAIDFRFNATGNKLYSAMMTNDESYIFVCTINNLDDITTTKINMPAFISYVEYDTTNNYLAAQLNNGTMAFISEEDNTTHAITKVAQADNEKYYLQGCLAFLPKHNMLINYSLYVPYITLWDTVTKTIIGEKKISPNTNRRTNLGIIIAKDENSFLTNNRVSGWNKQTLYTSEQKATLKWIKKCPTLYKAYILRLLYKAHKNNSAASSSDEHIQSFLEALPTTPHNIQHCIKEFFTVQKETTLVKTMEEKLDNLIEHIKSLFF